MATNAVITNKYYEPSFSVLELLLATINGGKVENRKGHVPSTLLKPGVNFVMMMLIVIV